MGSMGRCHGAHPETGNQTDLHWGPTRVDPHIKFRDFRFAVAFENRKMSWYITEKIINAFLGGTIPLYWGASEVFDVFNPDAFIYFDYNNPTSGLEKLAYLEKNRTAYQLALQAPILKHGKKTLAKYFSLSDSIGNGELRQEIERMIQAHPRGS